MLKWLKKIKFKLFLNLYQKTHVLTEKGEMILYYILNKYINCTKPNDFIENYELSINANSERFIEDATKCVKQFNIVQELDDSEANEEVTIKTVAHIFAALHLFETLLISMPKDLRQEWYAKIIDERFRERIQERIIEKMS